jgi:hypothetical protein
MHQVRVQSKLQFRTPEQKNSAFYAIYILVHCAGADCKVTGIMFMGNVQSKHSHSNLKYLRPDDGYTHNRNMSH